MANEIEFKVPIEEKDLKRFLENKPLWTSLNLNTKYVETKLDEFFENPETNKGNVVRIRGVTILKSIDDFFKPGGKNNKDSKYYLCYKRKNKSSDGLSEITEEYETLIEDHTVFEKIMEACKHNIFFRKMKKAINVEFLQDKQRNNYNIEFVCVNDKFYYLEVEWIGNFNNVAKNPNEVIKYLENRCRDLGFDPTNKDPRMWREIVK